MPPSFTFIGRPAGFVSHYRPAIRRAAADMLATNYMTGAHVWVRAALTRKISHLFEADARITTKSCLELVDGLPTREPPSASLLAIS